MGQGIKLRALQTPAQNFLPRKRCFMSLNVSRYNSEKTRLTLWLPQHHKDKYKTLCQMYNMSESSMFSIIVDEMFYEPLSPTLPKTIYNSTQRVFSFFRRENPAWSNRVNNF